MNTFTLPYSGIEVVDGRMQGLRDLEASTGFPIETLPSGDVAVLQEKGLV